MLTLIMLLVFLGVAAALWFQGTWSAIVTWLNTLLAGMLALNFFEPLAVEIHKASPSYTYFWDFLMLWAVFVVAFLVLRIATDLLSRARIPFPFWVDMAGRTIFSIWTAWLFVGFTLVTLHTAPVPPNPMGAFESPTSGTFLGLAPDRGWLGLMQSRSRGTFSRGDSGQSSRYDEDEGKRVFDPHSEFTIKYYQRRIELNDAEGFKR